MLSTVDERAATEVFERDCLIYLGTCVAPVGEGKDGEVCLQYEMELPSGHQTGQLQVGQLLWMPLADGEEVEVSLQPARRWDVGAGPGQVLNARVRGGVVGLVLDGRGRPIQMASDRVSDWQQALNLYE